MTRSLIDYLMNPVANIFFYFIENEFFENLPYFIITEIICLVMSFFGCVFNEYIILYCCGMARETQDEIANRAIVSRTESQNELDAIFREEKENEENDENANNIENSSTVISLDNYTMNI